MSHVAQQRFAGPPHLPELAARWQAIGQEWSHWYAQAASGPARRVRAARTARREASRRERARRPSTRSGLAALNAKYQARWQALWSAAMAALVPDAPGPRPVPDVDASRAGDRRFAAARVARAALLRAPEAGLSAARRIPERARDARRRCPEQDKQRLAFVTKQYVDALAPTNFMATNPEVLKRALSTEGASLVQGLANLAADARRGRISMSDEQRVRGRPQPRGDARQRRLPQRADRAAPVRADDRARAPAPARDRAAVHQQVLHPRPAARELLRALGRRRGAHGVHDLLAQHPAGARPHRRWDDYLEQGVLPRHRRREGDRRQRERQRARLLRRRHAARVRARRAAARGERAVASVTLLTTMLDFADPGDIGVYISRECARRARAGAAGRTARPRQRARRRVREPARQRARLELRRQQLPEGRDAAGVRPPALERRFGEPAGTDVRRLPPEHVSRQQAVRARRADDGRRARSISRASTMPAYIFASRDDHIVPWRSAYRSTRLLGGDITFVLGASGHIAGVVNPPAEETAQLLDESAASRRIADDWLAAAQMHPGSWWPHWGAWLARHAGARRPAPRARGQRRAIRRSSRRRDDTCSNRPDSTAPAPDSGASAGRTTRSAA